MGLREESIKAYEQHVAAWRKEQEKRKQNTFLRLAKWVEESCETIFGHKPDEIRPMDEAYVEVQIDDIVMVSDGQHFRLCGVCPKCNKSAFSTAIYSLVSLGEHLLCFKPGADHICVPPVGTTQLTWSERLVALLDERYELR